MELIG